MRREVLLRLLGHVGVRRWHIVWLLLRGRGRVPCALWVLRRLPCPGAARLVGKGMLLLLVLLLVLLRIRMHRMVLLLLLLVWVHGVGLVGHREAGRKGPHHRRHSHRWGVSGVEALA
jgi:hypothetical protein